MINRLTIIVTVLFLSFLVSYGQDTTVVEKKKKDDRPVRSPFESGVLIDNQTIVIPSAKTLEFIIQHRFGKFNSGTFDLIGLYAPSNIRLGLNYSIFDYLRVGIGTTKNNKLQDVNWKLSMLKQTRSGSVPLAITYYGNVEYNARDKESFGIEYKMAHRITYFHQLIIARKFNRLFSLQLAASYLHYNQVDTIDYPGVKHDNIAISASGRIKFSPQTSLIFEYDLPLTTPEQVKSNIGLGIEIATGSHAFQIFLGSFDGISYQRNNAYNTNDFTKGEILLGFNITRLWNF